MYVCERETDSQIVCVCLKEMHGISSWNACWEISLLCISVKCHICRYLISYTLWGEREGIKRLNDGERDRKMCVWMGEGGREVIERSILWS